MHRRVPGGGLDAGVRAGGQSGGVAGAAGRRGVAAEFGVQLSLRGLAVGGEGLPDGPAQFRVHGQASHPGCPVQQALQAGEKGCVVPADGGHGPCPGQLLVRPGGGLVQLALCCR